jgi:hypothetical protein
MTLAKKPLVVEKSPMARNSGYGLDRELKHLYQRRAVVVKLIESLEVYERCQPLTSMEGRKRKTA